MILVFALKYEIVVTDRLLSDKIFTFYRHHNCCYTVIDLSKQWLIQFLTDAFCCHYFFCHRSPFFFFIITTNLEADNRMNFSFFFFFFLFIRCMDAFVGWMLMIFSSECYLFGNRFIQLMSTYSFLSVFTNFLLFSLHSFPPPFFRLPHSASPPPLLLLHLLL